MSKYFIFFFLFSYAYSCVSQKKNIDCIFIKKMNLCIPNASINDTIKYEDYSIKDTNYDALIIIKSTYGTYDLILVNKVTKETILYKYKGTEIGFVTDRVASFNIYGAIEKYVKRRRYIPRLRSKI